MSNDASRPAARRFDDKKGRWWLLSWRDTTPEGGPAGYLFRAEDGQDEVFVPSESETDARAVERISLGDARQLLWMARSGLI